MDEVKIRKDANGNIINKSNKNYHITIDTNFVTIITVESYKRYNLLETYDEEDKNTTPFINKYTPKKVEDFSNNDPRGGSRGKCIII